MTMPIEALEQAQKEIETYKDLVLLLKEHNCVIRFSQSTQRWLIYIDTGNYTPQPFLYGSGDSIRQAIDNFKQTLED